MGELKNDSVQSYTAAYDREISLDADASNQEAWPDNSGHRRAVSCRARHRGVVAQVARCLIPPHHAPRLPRAAQDKARRKTNLNCGQTTNN